MVERLTSNGSKITDWVKFKTKTINSPSSPFKLHYYMNKKTGEVYYELDYKSFFNHQGNWSKVE